MGRAEGLIAIGISWQLLIVTLTLASASVDRTMATLLSLIGFVLVALGAWMTAWAKTLGS